MIASAVHLQSYYNGFSFTFGQLTIDLITPQAYLVEFKQRFIDGENIINAVD